MLAGTALFGNFFTLARGSPAIIRENHPTDIDIPAPDLWGGSTWSETIGRVEEGKSAVAIVSWR